MNLRQGQNSLISSEQADLRAMCIHPSGSFVEFVKGDIDQSISCRFERMVGLYSKRSAINTKTQVLTYAELNARANRVARAILDQCGERQEQVALLFEHDAPMIGSLLGALKARKIYVPLDPSYPLSRTAYILKDSQARLIVTNNKSLSLAKRLTQDAISLINIDQISTSLSANNLDLSVSPDAPAYILYTSGSTGQPKGVVQNHRNILHDIMEYTNTLRICPEERMTLFYSYSVNGAVRGILGPLLNGAVLYPFNIKDEGLAKLATFLIHEEISFYHSVPTVFRNLVANLTGKEKFPSLRLIRFGGERVFARDVDLYRKHFPDDCILYTGMGSTETGQVCQYFIGKQTRISGSVIPAGYPVVDKEVLLLDDDGQPLGFDEVGEIAVKSPYLAPGYWENPDLTRARFLRDSNGAERQIYLTGDFGRIRPDGCLEHLGRKDFQVKIRGYRIEVAETEMALLDFPGIEEAIVMAREDEPGSPRLIAYLVSGDHRAPILSNLRDFLKLRVPDHMVPAVFVFLDALPLTPNGKVDRGALPAPEQTRAQLQGTFVAPRTPIEELVAKIWVEALALDEVGIHDNFFELGGHSLSAAHVISRLCDTLQVELPLSAILELPTITELASKIAGIQAKQSNPDEITQILTNLESLSDEEAERLLAQQNTKNI